MAVIEIHESIFSYTPSHVSAFPVGVTVEGYLDSELPDFDPGVYDQPLLVRVNGSVLDREKWSVYAVEEGDVVSIAPRPHALPAWVIYVAVGVASVALSYALMPDIDDGSFQDQQDQSPTYDVAAQGNRARLGSPVPDRFGRHRVFPDWGAKPYQRYIDGDQYSYFLFSLGEGRYEKERLQIAETPLDEFSDVEWEFCDPGEAVTLFNTGLVRSEEVRDIELYAPNQEDYEDWSGPFPASDAGKLTTHIEYDLVSREGLWVQNDDGSVSEIVVRVLAEARRIDDDGNPVGVFFELGEHEVKGDSIEAVRLTFAKAVPLGRYEVRVKRISESQDPESVRLHDRLAWDQLRGVLQSENRFGESVWAVKIRSTNQLSALSDRKFNLVLTRILPVWDGSVWVDQATRSIAWAFCAVIRANGYEVSRLNLPNILRLARVWEARGDTFDYSFDTKGTMSSALDIICRAGRAVWRMPNGVFDMVRDEPKDMPDYMFTMRQMVSGSWSERFIQPDVGVSDYDGIEVEFINQDTWRADYVPCVLPGFEGKNLKRIKREGIVSRAQAFREGMFEAARRQYRNRLVQFKAELDGALPFKGSSIAVAHELPNFAVSGDVTDVSGDLCRLSEPLQITDGVPYGIVFRNEFGEPQGPFKIFPADSPREVFVDGIQGIEIYTGHQRERTSFMAGPISSFLARYVTEDPEPDGESHYRVSGYLDDPIVHSFDGMIDGGDIQPPPEPVIDVRQLVEVRGFSVKYQGTKTKPVLKMSWSPVEGASGYVVRIRRGEVRWKDLVSTAEWSATVAVPPGSGFLSIAAVDGERTGPWSEFAFDTDSDELLPDNPVGLYLDGPFIGPFFKVRWVADPGVTRWRVTIIDTLSGEVGRESVVVDPYYQYGHEEAAVDGVGRSITVRVRSMSEDGFPSASYSELLISNPQMGALVGASGAVFMDSAMVHLPVQDVPDFGGFRVWGADTADFVPSRGNLLIDGADAGVVTVPKKEGEALYLKAGGYDVWGVDGMVAIPIEASSPEVFLESQLNQSLKEQIDVSSILARIAQMKAVDVLVEEERTQRVEADAAEVIARDTAIAAAVDEERIARSAAIESVEQVVADQGGAFAQQMIQLFTAVGENSAAVQSQATSINGLRAEYTWKVQQNSGGRIVAAGIGLAADSVEGSMILMRADKFGFIHRSAEDDGFLAFSIENGQTVIDAAYIKTATIRAAHIADAAITAAKIKTAEIDTLHLKNGAVTVSSTATGSSSATAYVDAMGGAVVGVGYVRHTFTCAGGDNGSYGTVKATMSVEGRKSYASEDWSGDSGDVITVYLAVNGVSPSSVGVASVSVSVTNSGSTSGGSSSCSVGAFGARR